MSMPAKPAGPVRYTRVIECDRDVPIGPELVVQATIVGKKVRLSIVVDGEAAARTRASGLAKTLAKTRPWRKIRPDR